MHYAEVDDDPLPALEDLQIFGEPFPGRELLACGYSINGTTICNFEVNFSPFFPIIFCLITVVLSITLLLLLVFQWIRHFEDGSFNIIDGSFWL